MAKEKAEKKITEMNLDDININLLIKKRQSLLFAIIFILCAMLLLIFVGIPQIKPIIAKYQENKEEKAYLTRLKNKVRQLEGIKNQDNQEKLDKMHQVLPSYKPILELLTNLTYLSEEARVGVNHITINPGKIDKTNESKSLEASRIDMENQSIEDSQNENKTNTDEEEDTETVVIDSRALATKHVQENSSNFKKNLTLQLSIVGKISDIKRFMTLVETISPISSINQMDISFSDKKSVGQNQFGSAELTLNTYYFSGQIPAAIETPLPIVSETEKDILTQIDDFQPDQYEEYDEIKGGQEDPFQVAPPQKINIVR